MDGPSLGNTIKAAVLGGTASVIGGGKFANGAVTGAMSRALNDDALKAELDKFEDIKEHVITSDLYMAENEKIVLTIDEMKVISLEAYARGLNYKSKGYLYVDVMARGADTFLRGYSERLFDINGYTFKGGELNYVGTGAFSVAYGVESQHVNTQEVVWWNVLQYTGLLEEGTEFGQMHNLTSIPNNAYWNNFGRTMVKYRSGQ